MKRKNILDDDDGVDYAEIAYLWLDDTRKDFARHSLKWLADECANNWQNDKPLDRDRLIHAFAQLRDRKDMP